ncbi:hypothetical protein ACQ4LE_003243 [Meloidogyne hapla]
MTAKGKDHWSWRHKIGVPDILLRGDLFDRYDEENGSLDFGCLLRVDEYGFFLVWEARGKEAGVLDLAQLWEARPNGGSIKDLRIVAELEQRAKLTQTVGNLDPLDSRIVWLTYGQDLVAVNNLYFIAATAQVAKAWRESINEFLRTYKIRFACPMQCLQKQWRYLCLATNERGRIPLRNVVRTFSSGKPEKMVHKCLADLGLSGDKEREDLDVFLFTFDKFLRLYHKISPRTDIQELFVKLSGQKEYLTRERLITFLNDEQRDPRLNEILFPNFDVDRVNQLIAKYESDESYITQGKMSGDGFMRFLLSEENSPVFLDRTERHQDMDQPLCHYFINSSHNTYLTGRQYGGKSSTEIYRQVLLSGCRCIELDCWDGTGENKGEPIITHGKAMCTDVFFKDVLVQIKETAFLRSEWPVILSFENHCSKSNQLKMAKYCLEIFDDMLLTGPIKGHELEPGVPLPSPSQLKRKILIKNKRLKPEDEQRQMEQFRREGRLLDEEDEQSESATTSDQQKGVEYPSEATTTTNVDGENNSGGSGQVLSPPSERSHLEDGHQSTQQQPHPKSKLGPTVSSASLSNAFDLLNLGNSQSSQHRSSLSNVPSRHNSTVALVETGKQETSNVEKTEDCASGQSATRIVPSSSQQQPPGIISKLKQPLGLNRRVQDRPILSQHSEGGHESVRHRNSGGHSSSQHCSSSTSPSSLLHLVSGRAEKRSFRRPSVVQSGTDHSTAAALVDATPGKRGSLLERRPAKQKPVLSKEEEERLIKMVQESYYYQGATTNIHPLLSSLVCYTHPVKFSGFDVAEQNNLHFHMSSFSESTGLNLIKQCAPEWVNYNKRQLSRIYPKGARVDSSNFLPQIFWNAGCQMAALNFQTPDVCIQLNQGKFEYNDQCGYLLKPDFMRRPDRTFDPFSESPVDGVIAAHCSVRIISGQFLSERKVGTYVEVEMYGLPTDTIRKEHRSRLVPANSLFPVYNEEPFVFRKVILPELAVLRFAVYDDSGKQLGQRILPLDGLQSGYRHISLRTENNQPLTLPSLFVHLQLKTYVPDELSGLVDALADPKAYLSAQEKREEALQQMCVDELEDLLAPVRADSAGRAKASTTNFDGNASIRRVAQNGGSNWAVASAQANSLESGRFASNQSPCMSGKEPSQSAVITSGGSTPRTAIPLAADGYSTTTLDGKFQVKNIEVTELKKEKAFTKLQKRILKDKEEMRRRHQKLRENVLKSQQSSVEKLVGNGGTTTNILTTKLSLKRRNHPNNASSDAGESAKRHVSLGNRISDPVQMGDSLIRSLVQNQTDEWSTLLRRMEIEQFEQRKLHTKEEYELLKRILTDRQKQQQIALKSRFEIENRELKQAQTKKSMEDIRAVQQDKGIKTKAERDRRIKELNERNLKLFMEERKRLATRCRRHEDQLEKKHTEQLEALEKESVRALELEEMSHRETLLASQPQCIV